MLRYPESRGALRTDCDVDDTRYDAVRVPQHSVRGFSFEAARFSVRWSPEEDTMAEPVGVYEGRGDAAKPL